MLPIYLTKIHKVISVDTGEETKLSPNDKNVYGYLCGIGYNQGYDSIYPSVEQMAYNLSIATKSVSNSLNTLESIGLIKRKRTKQAGKWDSTFYWVYRPNMINRVHWADVNGTYCKVGIIVLMLSSSGRIKRKLVKVISFCLVC